ncbi:MAG: Pyridoxal-dependent decarboxylase [Candidatus Uhrbacteria bacterium GW2011_GWE2_40_58]|nr:MAG: Pyridoxal-dependent decarboxylase [Candidatus Uhrbacteria bacterium GW2011_GWF2_40_263]KKR67195.1 MAG: Pyridoxal-dependent decarboxylase [Candidatus Uhrbacteria bacterium GW2011_GWE2_40_58]OGL93758.1 MAG: hypothetical protein A2239_01880 [Candidatus Uhrbacteria bacterium RIFOXYA2_FULL_40_9]OGL96610.1 MAG: hypothetical protein A2332_03185 [Candidatus Uhrbacteria bacterium RIFOXYB2_FULL_41_18]HCB55766.1 hypothetical protein [Candidatus Uhrbacteria bacterium]
MSIKKDPAWWRWNEDAIDELAAREIIDHLTSLYEGKKRPFCYPGTPMNSTLLNGIPVVELMRQMHNNIGSHTHGEVTETGFVSEIGEGGFEGPQQAERELIWMIASQIGGTPMNVDGHFCGGGTEANLTGMWIGRQFLRKHPDPFGRGVCILTTPLVHYSVDKASAILDMGVSKWDTCYRCGRDHLLVTDVSGAGINLVGVNDRGEMDCASLEQVFLRKYAEGFRRFLIVCTAGTSALGSLDPIQEVSEWIDTKSEFGASFYLHVDASFGGFTIPFAHHPNVPEYANTPKIGFDVPNVMSMTLDADKMGHLPYPAGIFLCRKGLQCLIGRSVAYVRGNHDNTVAGSRTALSALLGHYWYRRIGLKGHRAFVQECLKARNNLLVLLRERFGTDHKIVKFLHASSYTNFLPLQIEIENGGVPEYLTEDDFPDATVKKWETQRRTAGFTHHLAPYHLRADRLPSSFDPNSCPITVYKLCVMPHNIPFDQLKKFVDDLEAVVTEALARNPS